jgi:hypothetical protein
VHGKPGNLILATSLESLADRDDTKEALKAQLCLTRAVCRVRISSVRLPFLLLIPAVRGEFRAPRRQHADAANSSTGRSFKIVAIIAQLEMRGGRDFNLILLRVP